MFSCIRGPFHSINILRKICSTDSQRWLHDNPRYAFVFDHSYDLVSKLRQQTIVKPQIDPVNGFPSSFARNLLHPNSNHMVSQYAREYFKRATPYYGEFPTQFFPSEMCSIKTGPLCDTEDKKKHSILIYPDQIYIKDIEPEHIPHLVRFCDETDVMKSLCLLNDSRIERLDGVNIYFFCDVSTIDRVLILFQWFDYCFRRSNYDKVHYIFSSGNLKNDQSSAILIHKGDYRIILSQHMTLREVDQVVQHMIQYS